MSASNPGCRALRTVFSPTCTPLSCRRHRAPLEGCPSWSSSTAAAFVLGNGNETIYTGQSIFMDEDVVLVTLNYRLGALGFFTTHDSHASGNYGLLRDQVMLLHWVHDNIAAFGGDPGSVTIFWGLGRSFQCFYSCAEPADQRFVPPRHQPVGGGNRRLGRSPAGSTAWPSNWPTG